MSVFQPLYFAGGRYTAGTDRKLLAAVFGADSTGDRLVGVIPSNIGTDSLRVSWTSALTVNIATGMCLIADQSAQNNESPGLYLAGVDTNTESITLPANSTGSTRYDVIYAEVKETASVIVSKALESDVAELTTSSAHGFSVGQTVVVSGVDDIFDGTYIITVVTSTKFKYARPHANIASFASPTAVTATATGYPNTGASPFVTASITSKNLTSNIATLLTASAHNLIAGEMITVKGVDAVFDGVHQLIEGTTGSTLKYSINKVADNIATVSNSPALESSVAVARVPFAIKQVRNTTAGAGVGSITAIELAEITVATGATAINQANIKDLRKFVPTSGGMNIYNSTLAPDTARFPGASNPTPGMMRYDASTNTLQVYDSTAATFRTLYANSGSGEVFPRIGSTATTAAAGNHNHDTYYALNITTGTTVGSASNVTISSESSTAATTITSRTITIPVGASESVLVIANASFDITGSGQTTYMGIYVNSSTTMNNSMVIGSTDGTFAMSTAFITTLSGSLTPHTIYLKAYKSSGSGVTAVATIHNLTVVPIKALT